MRALRIAHLDCDAFFAAVEKRDRLELTDVPVIVGGGKRGVVSTCCYIARTYGVHSAMPMFKALKACPHAVVLRPDGAKYVAVAREIRARMEALTPLVQPLSIDEAFLDMSGTERLHGEPVLALVRLARGIERDLGISVSIGLSHNRFLAKLASDTDKPRGFTIIGRGEARALLARRSVKDLPGVGRHLLATLARDGIETVGHLQALSERELAARYGSMGLRLHRLSHGVDARAVTPHEDRKSVSAETTFSEDLATPKTLLPHLRRLSEKVSLRLKEKGIGGHSVTLKLKDSRFQLRTRRALLARPTQLERRVYAEGRRLLAREIGETRFRLIGIGVGDLVSGSACDGRDLVEPRLEKEAAAERAVDSIRRRFGPRGIGYAQFDDGRRT